MAGLQQFAVELFHPVGLALEYPRGGHGGEPEQAHVAEHPSQVAEAIHPQAPHRDLLDAAYIAHLPVTPGGIGMGVVAGDAGLTHQDGCGQPEAGASEAIALQLGETLLIG